MFMCITVLMITKLLSKAIAYLTFMEWSIFPCRTMEILYVPILSRTAAEAEEKTVIWMLKHVYGRYSTVLCSYLMVYKEMLGGLTCMKFHNTLVFSFIRK